MKKLFYLIVLFLISQKTDANNVTISGIGIFNNGPDSTYIEFGLAWENGWRVLNGPGNYDGAWVFFKYRTEGGEWKHLKLNTITTSDQVQEGLDYWRCPYGAVFYRSATNIGFGNTQFNYIRLTVERTLPFNVQIRAFVVEMVYIPSLNTPTYIGDGNGYASSQYAFNFHGTNNYARSNFPTSVEPNTWDDSAIEPPNTFSFEGGPNDGFDLIVAGDNPYWPTGSPLWCMKYEITQGAYRDFLNSLTLQQQTTRTSYPPTDPIGTCAICINQFTDRNYVEIKSPSNGTDPAVYGCDASSDDFFDAYDDGESVACGNLNWADVAAWLDWASLSPMTEIQYERICRGVSYPGNLPVTGEFAWGDTTIFSETYVISDAFTSMESIPNASATQGNANIDANFQYGPLRSGIFATSSSNRRYSGATFYGVMEMTGNIYEACVSIGNVAGRSYNKEGNTSASSFGNGTLHQNGNALTHYWPGSATDDATETTANGQVTNGYGIIYRGGAHAGSVEASTVSDRTGKLPGSDLSRYAWAGGRGVIVPAMYQN